MRQVGAIASRENVFLAATQSLLLLCPGMLRDSEEVIAPGRISTDSFDLSGRVRARGRPVVFI
jgi:hypothetical protein